MLEHLAGNAELGLSHLQASVTMAPGKGFFHVNLGNTLKDMVSRGTDFGTRFNFLNGKLSGKYNYFRTTRYNSPATNGVITQINNLINSNRWDDIDTAAGASTAINQLGIVPLNANGDYNTSSNYGYEWELSATVINGLRLTLNGGASSRATDNSTFYPLTRAYMANPDNVKQFRALLEDAGGSLDTTQKPQSNGRPVAGAEGLAVLAPLPGKALGLDKEWLLRALTAVGNYGEIFERHVGEKTPVGLKRGANALWTQGGLMYALPLR